MIEQRLSVHQTQARDALLHQLAAEHAAARLWQRDASLWYPAPETQARIRQRLGWLDLPADADVAAQIALVERMLAERSAQQIVYVVAGVLGRAVRLWLSLVAPRSDLPIIVLDAAEQAAVAQALDACAHTPTLVVHAGPFDTPQAQALAAALPADLRVPLPADVGERFGALTAAALLPAALLGLHWRSILHHVREVDAAWRTQNEAVMPFLLGATLGAAAQAGRDLLHLHALPPQAPLVRWLEALVGGALGKHRRGFVPFVDAPPPVVRSEHSIVVRVVGEGGLMGDDRQADLQQAGVPVLRCAVPTAVDAAIWVWTWQLAIVVAAMVIGLNPFDAPDADVINARIAQQLADPPARLPVLAADERQALRRGRFVAIAAYLPHTAAPQLAQVRASLATRLSMPVTLVFPLRDWLWALQLLHAGRPDGTIVILSAAQPSLPDPRLDVLQRLLRTQLVVERETWRRMERPVVQMQIDPTDARAVADVLAQMLT